MERKRFFQRKPLDFDVATSSGFAPVSCVNVDDLLFVPVTAGLWKQHETWDGTYTLDDLLDIVEALKVKSENERRASEAAETEARMNRG